MSQHSRQELVASVSPRYRKASGKERERILEEFVESHGYHRKYAIQVLNHPRKPAEASSRKRHRAVQYSLAVQQALIARLSRGQWHV